MKKSLFKIVTVLCTAFCGLTMVACSTGGESTTNENNNQNTEEEETSITFADFIANHSDKAIQFYNDNFFIMITLATLQQAKMYLAKL